MQKPPYLYQVTALLRGQILEDLEAKKAPRIGEFEPETLKRAFTKGTVQMGAQKFAPNGCFFEFIFPDPSEGTVVLTVCVPSSAPMGQTKYMARGCFWVLSLRIPRRRIAETIRRTTDPRRQCRSFPK